MQRIKIDTRNRKKYEATVKAILRTGTIVFTGERGVYKVAERTVRKLKEQGIEFEIVNDGGAARAKRGAL
jgi:hypothetical protein